MRWHARNRLHALMMTGIIVVVVTVINTVFGVMLAFYLVDATWIGRRLKQLLNSIVDLPFAVSPVIGGLMIVLMLGPNTVIGAFFEDIGFKIVYALPGMILATLFVTFPLMVREVMPVLQEIGAQQEEAASTLGAYAWYTFWHVTWPSIRWGVIYGVVLDRCPFARRIRSRARRIGQYYEQDANGDNARLSRCRKFQCDRGERFALVLAAFSVGLLLLMEWAKKKKGSALGDAYRSERIK